jgi:hypothetical protein
MRGPGAMEHCLTIWARGRRFSDGKLDVYFIIAF